MEMAKAAGLHYDNTASCQKGAATLDISLPGQGNWVKGKSLLAAIYEQLCLFTGNTKVIVKECLP